VLSLVRWQYRQLAFFEQGVVPEVGVEAHASLLVAHFVGGRVADDLVNSRNRLKPFPIASENPADSLRTAAVNTGQESRVCHAGSQGALGIVYPMEDLLFRFSLRERPVELIR
jgi:hypothetical protein